MGAMYIGMGLFLAGILLGQVFGQWAVPGISLPGFAVAFVGAMIGYHGGLRCPRCRGNLGPLVMVDGGLRVSRRLGFCPYCGCGLDEEL
jgi:hypothetical protein